MTRFLRFGLASLGCLTTFALAAAAFAEQGAVYIDHILCEGAQRTSCLDLQQLLGLTPQRAYTEDELNALNLKLAQLGYYAAYRVALQPHGEPGRADLHIAVTEKETARHTVGGRLQAGGAGHAAYAAYAYTDHNFLGKGYFLQLAFNSAYAHRRARIAEYNVEASVPVGAAWSASLRLVSPSTYFKPLAMAGLSYQLSEASSFTAYIGNFYGGNFTYHTEDNAFIPMQGAALGFSVLYENPLLPGGKAFAWPALEARKHWQVGHWAGRSGVLTLGLDANSILNPALRSFVNPDRNRSLSASGLMYALVSQEAGRRAAVSVGLAALGFGEALFYRASAGYKAALENLDVSLSLEVGGQRGLP